MLKVWNSRWVCKPGARVDCRRGEGKAEKEGKGKVVFALLLIHKTTTDIDQEFLLQCAH